MEIMGDYLMCRFYPDFTKTRLEMGLPFPIPPEHRAAFDHELSRRIPPEEQAKPREKKGTSIILGLWMFPTDAREPLKEVMMRYVHSYCAVIVISSERTLRCFQSLVMYRAVSRC